MRKTLAKMAAVIAVSGMIVSCQPKGEEIQLFNGTDLSNWTCYTSDTTTTAEEVFGVKDDVIHVKGNLGWMRTNERYTNYTLKVEWRWVEELSNSGIFINQQDQMDSFPNAIECQLMNGKAGDFVLLGGSDLAEFVVPEGKERPAFPVVQKFTESNEKPLGEWNQAEIKVTDKGEICVKINGVEQNKGTNSLHKEGFIGLQSEGKPIEFRNVTLTKW
ncbi:MAG: DUF1080 domain-containing protein [Bacteroidales bacterium]